MQTSSAEAAQALAAMQDSRERLLKAADCPPSRHVVFAALMTALVACPAAPYPLMFAIEAVILMGVAVVVQWDKRRTGMFVNGYRAGKTLWVTFAGLALELSLFGLGFWLAKTQGVTWAPLALAAPAFAFGMGTSFLWGAIYRRELQGRA